MATTTTDADLESHDEHDTEWINWENRYCNDCNTILVDRRYVD